MERQEYKKKKKTKLRLADALIFLIASFVAETWTIKQAGRRRIESFALWVYNSILGISWASEKCFSLRRIKYKLCKYLSGHIARKGNNESINRWLQNRRSKKKRKITDVVVGSIGATLNKALHMTNKRQEQRKTRSLTYI